MYFPVVCNLSDSPVFPSVLPIHRVLARDKVTITLGGIWLHCNRDSAVRLISCCSENVSFEPTRRWTDTRPRETLTENGESICVAFSSLFSRLVSCPCKSYRLTKRHRPQVWLRVPTGRNGHLGEVATVTKSDCIVISGSKRVLASLVSGVSLLHSCGWQEMFSSISSRLPEVWKANR